MEARCHFEKNKMNNVHLLEINVCLAACFRYAKPTHCYLHSFDQTNSYKDSDLHNLHEFKMATRAICGNLSLQKGRFLVVFK